MPFDRAAVKPHNAPMTTKLKAVRKARKLSVRQVARDVDTHPQNYNRIERGEQVPKRDLARRIFEYYQGEVTLGEVYDPEYALDYAPG